eukprot:6354501-Karenia_brevis.AAC.1
MRKNQGDRGRFFPSAYRKWKRKLYSNVRQRQFHFMQKITRQVERAEKRVSNEDLRNEESFATAADDTHELVEAKP